MGAVGQFMTQAFGKNVIAFGQFMPHGASLSAWNKNLVGADCFLLRGCVPRGLPRRPDALYDRTSRPRCVYARLRARATDPAGASARMPPPPHACPPRGVRPVNIRAIVSLSRRTKHRFAPAVRRRRRGSRGFTRCRRERAAAAAAAAAAERARSRSLARPLREKRARLFLRRVRARVAAARRGCQRGCALATARDVGRGRAARRDGRAC